MNTIERKRMLNDIGFERLNPTKQQIRHFTFDGALQLFNRTLTGYRTKPHRSITVPYRVYLEPKIAVFIDAFCYSHSSATTVFNMNIEIVETDWY